MQYIAWLKWGTIGALFSVILIPFVIADGGASWATQPLTYIPFVGSFFPFITGKSFLFRIIVEIALLLYVLLALKRPEYRPRASLVLWTVAGFVAWMGIATLLSVDPVKSFWSNFERMEGYVSLLHLFAFFVIAGAVFSVDKLWDKFLATSVGASAFMGLLALLQIVGALPISSQSGPRADTTFGNATYLAVYMLMHFFLTLYLLSRERVSRGMQAFYGVALVLQAMGIYYTQTRGALLGLIGGLIVVALWVAIRGGGEYRPLRKLAIGGLVGIVVLAGLFFALRNTPIVQSSDTLARLASISLDDPTTRSRLFNIWPMALQGAMERPIAGWGQENFSYIFNAHYRPEMYNQESWFDRAHNQFLDWLVAGGIPAFVLYVALYILVALAVIRSQLTLTQQAAILGLLAAYAFNNMFVFDNLVSAMYFFALLGLAHSLTRKELPGAIWMTRPVSDHTLAIAAPIVALVIFSVGWTFNAPAIARAHVLALSVNNPPETALPQFKAAIGPTVWPGNRLGWQEAVEQLMQRAGQIAGSADVDPGLKKDTLDTAYDAGRELLAQRQNDARLELFMASMLSGAGNFAEARKYAELAVSHSPQKQQLLFQLATTQLQTADPEAAIATFKKALEAAPDYRLARILYAGSLYTVGQIAQGDQVLKDGFGEVLYDDDQLIRVFAETKQYDRAAAILQKRIDKDPENIEPRLRQAEIYLRAGNKAKAIEVLRAVSGIRPDLAGQIEQLITQIQSGLLNL